MKTAGGWKDRAQVWEWHLEMPAGPAKGTSLSAGVAESEGQGGHTRESLQQRDCVESREIR